MKMGEKLNSEEEVESQCNQEQNQNLPSGPSLLFCWKERSRRERYLMLTFTSVFAVAFLLAFSLVSILTENPQSEQLPRVLKHTQLEPACEPTTKQEPGVCLTQGCVRAAAAVIERLNETADPCDDFFDFACGNFVKKMIIPDEKSSVTMFSEVQDELREKMRILLQEKVTEADSPATEMAKNLFVSCMNTDVIEAEGLKPLHAILAELGGWPVLKGDQWNEANFSWIEINYINRRIGFSVDYLFDFSVTTDVKNSSWRMIWFDQPALGMSREYLMKGLNDSDVKAYLKYSIDVAVLLGADPERAEKEMLDVLNFQIQMANISLPREERRNMTKLYNVMKLGEMQNLTGDLIPWVQYINKLLPDLVQVDENERVGVSDTNFFTNLTILLRKTPKRVIANYLLWRISAASGSYLSENFRNIQLEYSKKLTGKATNPPRWKECMGVVSGKLSYAIGSLYSRNFFNEEAKAQALELVQYVREEFDRILNSVDWMDETTRHQALQKSKSIRPHIAYPDELLQDHKLTEYYKNLTVDNKSLLDNMRRIGIFGSDYTFSKLRDIVDKLDWKRHAAVAVVNAYYSSIENSIKFPAGILQGVFFEPDRPKYMNFGGIGFVIGHEITHGFDDQGKQFDSVGNLKNWWEPMTEKNFLDKAKCIIYQYGNYTAPENGLKLNGINTQGENIADNGGIKEAYEGYQKWVSDHGMEDKLPGLKYTPNQLFWISAGQVWCSKYRSESLKVRILTGVHSPGRFRVVGSFSNSEDFSRDWSCPVGSKMNPQHKCSVWQRKISERKPDVDIESIGHESNSSSTVNAVKEEAGAQVETEAEVEAGEEVEVEAEAEAGAGEEETEKEEVEEDKVVNKK